MNETNRTEGKNRRAPRSQQAVFLLALGGITLLGNLFTQSHDLARVWSLGFTFALAAFMGWRSLQRRGGVPRFVLWWAFGTGLALVHTVLTLTGVQPDAMGSLWGAAFLLGLGGMMFARRA